MPLLPVDLDSRSPSVRELRGLSLTPELAEFYRRSESALWILSDVAPKAEDLEELKKENQVLRDRVDGLEKALVNYLAGYKKIR
jgi:hypothetical protein